MIDQRWTLAHPRPDCADMPKPLTASTNLRTFFATNALATRWKESLASLRGLLPAGGSTAERPPFVAAWMRISASLAPANGYGLDRRAARVLGPSVQSVATSPRTFPDRAGTGRPFVPSSPVPWARLRAERIGGLTRLNQAVQWTLPMRGPTWYALFPPGNAPHFLTPSLVCEPVNRRDKSRRARIFRSYQPNAHTGANPLACPDRQLSSGSRASTQIDPEWLPTNQTDCISDTARGRIHSPASDSKTEAWWLPTAESLFAFNLVNASMHLASSYPINRVRRSRVRQDSDFRWKSRVRKKLGFSCVPSGVRRPPERLATARTVSMRQPEILNPVN